MTKGKPGHGGDGNDPVSDAAAQAGAGSEDASEGATPDSGQKTLPKPFAADYYPGSHPDCDYCGDCAKGVTCPLD